MAVELRHLRYFLAVAEELHFGRAAQRLRMAQPPLSRQIRALESELAVRLLLRTARGVELTDAGRLFRDEARAALERVEGAVESVRGAERHQNGGLAVAFAPEIELALLPRLVPPFVEHYADARLDIESLETDEQVAALQARRIQLGIVPLPVATSRDVVVDPLVSEELCVVLPQKHPLVGRPRLSVPALAAEPLVCLPRRVSRRLHDLVFGLFREAGVTPRIVCHVSRVPACLALVAAQVGVAVLPAGTRGVCSAGVVYRPLGLPAARLEIGMIHRRDEPSELRRAFMRSAHAVFGDPETSTLACRPAEKVVKLQAR